MKRVFALILLLTVFIFGSRAGDGEFAVNTIPRALLKDANAVVRLEEIRFEIRSTTETVTKTRYVITILNEKADRFAGFAEGYNKHTSVESVEGYLYDANGNQVKKIKKKDLQDLSGVSDISLMDDNRYKAHNFYYRNYPYTVEYVYETRHKASLFFPGWVPQGAEGVSVEKSSMSVVAYNGYQFRYKATNYAGEPVISEEKNAKVTTWSAENLKAVWREVYSPRWRELVTSVILGPTDFQMDDYKGNMKSWQDFGKFLYALKLGRDQLPPAVAQEVHKIADGVSDPKEKVARLYEFMQRNTRYVSIQLGIGGWQPYDAAYVASKGYGDCKALTNYMYSLLKEAGIKSYYSVINAGRNEGYVNADFPSQQFNHVILMVPTGKDSVWLECTSQTDPPGYLGGFTSDRLALVVDEDGGKLVRTPIYGMNDNIQTRSIKAVLADDATLDVKVMTRYGGVQQDQINGVITQLSRDKVKEYLHNELDFATYDVNDFRYQEQKSMYPHIDEMLDITVQNYANITGKRLFLLPNVMNRSGRRLSADSVRRTDVILGSPYLDIDSVEIEMPKGFGSESVPLDVAIESKFGKYNSSVKLKDNKLFYHRKVEYYGGRYPASDYQDLVKYFESVYKADRNKVVMVRTDVGATEKKGF